MNFSRGGAAAQCCFRCAAAPPREKFFFNEPQEYKIACVELLVT